MTTNQLTFIVTLMIISITVIAVFSIHRTGKVGKLTVLGALFVNILTTLLGS